MPGTRIFTLNLLAAAALLAQSPEYLPLQQGNTWIYKGSAGTFTLQTGGAETFGENQYFPLRGLPTTPVLYLRNTPEGRIYQWDMAAKLEVLYLDTAAAESPTGVDPCNAASRIESREGKYAGPVGEFGNVLDVRYTAAQCADAGLVSDQFLPWVGLLARTQQTIAGPRTYHLVYARLGGVTVLTPAEISFSLAVTAAQDVRLALRNMGPAPLELTFPTSQQFEVEVYDQKNQLVYRWSDGMGFLQVVTTQSVSGERIWLVSLPSGRLAPGRYTVKGWLTTTEPGGYAATATATIPKN
ncbi:MAG: hypothetical protein HY821_05490 [Acidobacteria bacterium]|nr:hypothetical protein [Acidobacteriota bacterium]